MSTGGRGVPAPPAGPRVERAVLIDGHSMCYRAFYAIRSLATSTGKPTNAVYGMLVMVRRLQEELQPDYLAVAFDVAAPTFRHERFEAYKRHRKPMPEALIEQWPTIKELLAAYRIPVFEQAGFEADDVLATMAKQLSGGSREVWIVTADKDILQMVGPSVKVYNPQLKGAEVMDAKAVETKFGVEPRRVAELLALTGDVSDGIPPVPGIGPKTAVELLQQFTSLEQLVAHPERIGSESVREAVRRHAQVILDNFALTHLRIDVPVVAEAERLRVQQPDARRLWRLCRDLEFKSLLKTMTVPQEGAAVPVILVEEDQAWQACLDRLRRAQAVALTPDVIVGDRTLVWRGCGLSCDGGQAWYIAASEEPASWLAAVLAEASIGKILYDAKALWHLAAQQGWTLAGLQCDLRLAAYVLNPAQGTATLNELTMTHLDAPAPAAVTELETPAARRQACGRAAALSWRLGRTLQEQLREKQLDRLYREVELPLIEVLAQMERRGIALDPAALSTLAASMRSRLTALTRQIYEAAGGTFNINSPKQLAGVLFDQLKLPVTKRTKTGPSTDMDVLQKLSDQHPLPRLLLEYRELSKLSSTYVEVLPGLLDPMTHRLHTTFHQSVTATGRLSSSDPNVQNIPIKTDLGRQIRQAFVAGEPGWALLSADYSQIELRVLAHLSGDERLCRAFGQGRDIHTFTASLIYGVEEPQVQPEMRNAAKTVNFGIVYGISAYGLAQQLAIPQEAAQAFIDAYFERYPGVRAYRDRQIALARREGYVTTLLGRRRYIPELQSADGTLRQFGERTAVNTPVQGTAADLIKLAMIRVHRALPEAGLAARLLLQVHDELLFELPDSELLRAVPVVREAMERALRLEVPVVVTMKAGQNWLEMRGLGQAQP
ncbi:MAG: DNA polymerase I [Candidatus Omnitrophica bacterium]|nr:DNA polymerase I [Candidatus Omnitrophota bacterium]